ncbi:phosphatidate cytidylyltransferase [Cohnella thailandensis]|uniref:Phosphatidate cytidylyltransferase n=1 Tax=Cohnella thailandensis TaxID=557557 RepID=A0A841T4E9_9BACL|nr:phosphatidate cytidylyltransferase [Cohnella thailandensis]MBB6636737.1 phosphatidate cytidylyltransferase [Cohnella thailandensis]MBP1973387.1 phosphatidate cytidylyltransferase [Cohnella thailandensis]
MVQRLISGVLAGLVFLGVILLGDGYYSAFLTIVALLGYREFVKLNQFPSFRWDVFVGYLAVLLLSVPTMPFGWEAISIESCTWLLMFLLLSATVFSKNKIHLEHASLLFIGAFYIGIGFRYMVVTRDLEHGVFWTLLTFFCIWASDAGAYFVGRAIGKTKLWPAISPNKTVEGAVGGLAISVVVALVFYFIYPEWVGFWQAIGIALASAVAGTLGDLIQSAYKRLRGVKDSGNLLPGHGGALDRTDSWLIVFPFVHFLGLLPN